MASIEQWEYAAVPTIISGWRNDTEQFEEFMQQINLMGMNGWEMTTESVIHTKGYSGSEYPMLFFKRRLPAEPNEDARH